MIQCFTQRAVRLSILKWGLSRHRAVRWTGVEPKSQLSTDDSDYSDKDAYCAAYVKELQGVRRGGRLHWYGGWALAFHRNALQGKGDVVAGIADPGPSTNRN